MTQLSAFLQPWINLSTQSRSRDSEHSFCFISNKSTMMRAYDQGPSLHFHNFLSRDVLYCQEVLWCCVTSAGYHVLVTGCSKPEGFGKLTFPEQKCHVLLDARSHLKCRLDSHGQPLQRLEHLLYEFRGSIVCSYFL